MIADGQYSALIGTLAPVVNLETVDQTPNRYQHPGDQSPPDEHGQSRSAIVTTLEAIPRRDTSHDDSPIAGIA